ncbi:IS1-like element transposase [Epilithonimonas sp.]|uniref:IS1/IS1595 family N-terminal zinc-binding domain-containing protein n=1 Tax=Epilithonimonas sp. TaxID=2894511 RepID=UPI0035AF9272
MIDLHNRCIRVSDTNVCKFCFSGAIIKNGTTKTKKQQYFCKTCQKRFLDYYSYQAYRKVMNTQIIQLAKEGLGIRSIARILDISANTVLKRILKIAEHINPPVLRYHQCYELDELRFFIRKKNNPV